MLRPFVSQKNLRSFAFSNVIFRHPVHFLAFGFGVGLFPWGPGTFGTLVAFPLFYICKVLQLSDAVLIFVSGLAAWFGCFLCGETSKNLGVHDHRGIVWDEIVAMFALLIFVPTNWLAWLWIFGLFRLFDIVKPFPIRYLDQHVDGGLGIMLDDWVAAIFAWLTWLALWQLASFRQWILSFPNIF